MGKQSARWKNGKLNHGTVLKRIIHTLVPHLKYAALLASHEWLLRYVNSIPSAQSIIQMHIILP